MIKQLLDENKKPTGLYAIEIPKESEDGCELRGRTGRNTLLSFYGCAEAIELPEGKWEYLGTCDKSEVSFDVESYVKKVKWGKFIVRYMDYKSKELAGLVSFETTHESFYSLLEANGITFVNPLGNKPDIILAESQYLESMHKLNLWQEAESKLSTKVAILKQL